MRTLNWRAFLAVGCGCLLVASCNKKGAEPAGEAGRELRPHGYFITSELPGTNTEEKDPPRYVVVIVGVPGDWFKVANQPEFATDAKGMTGEPALMSGTKPQAFSLILADNRVAPGKLFSFFSGSDRRFSAGFAVSHLKAGGPEYVEHTIAVAFALEPKDHEPPFRIKFRDHPEVNVPAKRYEYPAVLSKQFRDQLKR